MRYVNGKLNWRSIRFFERVDVACIIPTLYGVVYRDYQMHRAVCCPIPFNLVLGLAWKLYWKVVHGVDTGRVNLMTFKSRYALEQDAYCRGYDTGWDFGYAMGMEYEAYKGGRVKINTLPSGAMEVVITRPTNE